MILNKKVVNYKVLELLEIFNFRFESFSNQDCLKNSNFNM
jgi:hypothetical protein